MEKRYLVCLTTAQRAELERRDAGSLTRRQRNRVHVLLRADAGETDADIADALGTHVNTVARIRRRFAASGLDALAERPRSGVPAKLDGKAEALIIALACSPAPAFNYPQPSFRNPKPRSMSVSRVSPRQSTRLPGGGSCARAR